MRYDDLLEAAHEKRVIHRDLENANIKINWPRCASGWMSRETSAQRTCVCSAVRSPPAPRWSKPSHLVGLEYEGTADPATAVPSHLRRLKELAVKYSE